MQGNIGGLSRFRDRFPLLDPVVTVAHHTYRAIWQGEIMNFLKCFKIKLLQINRTLAKLCNTLIINGIIMFVISPCAIWGDGCGNGVFKLAGTLA